MKNNRLIAAVAYRHRLLNQLPELEGELIARLQRAGPIRTKHYLAQRNGTGYQILQNMGNNKFAQLTLWEDNTPIKAPQPQPELFK